VTVEKPRLILAAEVKAQVILQFVLKLWHLVRPSYPFMDALANDLKEFIINRFSNGHYSLTLPKTEVKMNTEDDQMSFLR
jgi:hypothetical protein